MTWRVTSPAGRELIASFEGERNKAYRDIRGIWTCGIGHTGPDVTADTVWTDTEVQEHFTADLRRFEIVVNRLVTVKLCQNQFDSLISLVFNIGITAFASSTLLRLLNKGQYDQAVLQFGRWIYAGSALAPGLARRRKAEAELFMRRHVEPEV